MKHRAINPPKSRSCVGKVKMDEAKAHYVVSDLARTQGALMSAYACQYGCKLADGSRAWHVGHEHFKKRR